MSTHTPGPWEVMPDEFGVPYLRVRGTRPVGRYKIANVLGEFAETEQQRAEVRANAKLIQRAPELLEACVQMLAYLREQPDSGMAGLSRDKQIAALRVAIAGLGGGA